MSPRPRIFRDPVHVDIEFSRTDSWDVLGIELIDTPEVQRLRHVRQLGLANFAYQGVEHSRFVHSIGVCHLAKRLYRSSMRNAGKGEDEEELCAVVAAALLHDTGHPPFSHAFEKELGVNHESITVRLIRGDSAVNEALKKRGGEPFVERVAAHIDGTSDAPTVYIISSQLDADRLDYVLRDGYYAGVPNARFDLERILQMSLRDDAGILFDARAQYAIEGYFLARYHLYLQLYYHKTVRAAEAMLRSLIRRAKVVAREGHDLGAISPNLLRLLSTDDVVESITIADAHMWAAFSVWSRNADEILADLSERLWSRNLFRAVEIEANDKDRFYNDCLPLIRDLAESRGYDPNFYVLTDATRDTPYKVADMSMEDSVRIIGGDGKLHRLETNSGIIGALQAQAYLNLRCCVPRELRDEAVKILNKK